MFRRAACLITVLVLVGLAWGNGDSTDARESVPLDPIVEFVTATAMGCACYMPGLAAGWLVADAAGHQIDIEGDSGSAYLIGGIAVGYALGSACGAWLAGDVLPGRHGRFVGALAGSAVGAAVGFPIFYLIYQGSRHGDISYLGAGAFAILTAAGSVVGYDLSRPSKSTTHAAHYQLLPPTLAIGAKRISAGRSTPVLHAQLLRVRL